MFRSTDSSPAQEESGPKHGGSRRILRDVLAVAAMAGCLALIHATGLIWPVSRTVQDLRYSWSDRAPSGRIVLVDIDARSLAEIGVWPWDRRIYADLVRVAAESSAEAVAFDVDFSARSTPEADAAFAAAIDDTGLPVYLASLVQNETANSKAWQVSMAAEPLASRTWPALVNVPVDRDGKVRATLFGLDTPSGPLQSLPALVAGDARATGLLQVDYGIDATRLKRVSLVDVVNRRVPQDVLAGQTLLVGATALELRDLFHVPRYGILSGSTILALGAETVILDRVPDAPALPVVILAVVTAVSALFFATVRAGAVVLPLAGTAVLVEGIATQVYLRDAGMLDTGPALLGLAAFALWGGLREIDVTLWLLRLARIRIANADRLLYRIVEDGFDGIVVADAAGRIMHMNRAAAEILRIEGPARALALSDLPDGLAKAGSGSSAADTTSGVAICTVELGGEPRILEVASRPVPVKGPDGDEAFLACLSFRDVTERQREADRMEYLAHHDGLTGLLNRRGLERILVTEAAERCGLLVLFDLDRFKDINVKLGHAVGDVLLREVATRAAFALRAHVTLARLGGDAFAALVSGPGQTVSAAPAIALLKELARPFRFQNHSVSVSATAGLRFWEPGETSAAEILRQADLALGEAKRTLRGGAVVFSADLEDARLDALRLQQDLPAAFERGEFSLVFQPQVSLLTGRIVGAEALCRWFHPDRGPVPPTVFIPLLEEVGLIHRLGAWTLAAACREATSWPDHVRVAVNVSAMELEMGDVPSSVADVLSATGLDPRRLELEITETAFAKETPRIYDHLRRIQSFGVGFALDDFGTGYSSLGYIHRFPISKIKIDRSFVRGLPQDETGEAIIRSVVALAGSLRLQTVAEGVETRAQDEVLRRIGCSEGQGYLYARPVDAETFRSLLRRDGEGVRLLAG